MLEVSNPNREHDVTTLKEVGEFLKLIKRSDYKMVDQLHETPSNIPILLLQLNS